MKVHRLSPAEEVEWLLLGDAFVDLREYFLSDMPAQQTLDLPLALKRITHNDFGRRLRVVDLPWVSSLTPCVVVGRADEFTAVLGPARLEALDGVADDGKRLKLIHVMEERHAIDLEKSDLVHYSSGAIMTARRFSFHRAALSGATIFRDPRLTTAVFITDVVVDRLAELGFTGWSPEVVWQDQ